MASKPDAARTRAVATEVQEGDLLTTTARIEIDWATCAGHGRCCELAPDLFDIDHEDQIVIRRQPVTASDLDDAERAAEACPERAIRIERAD